MISWYRLSIGEAEKQPIFVTSDFDVVNNCSDWTEYAIVFRLYGNGEWLTRGIVFELQYVMDVEVAFVLQNSNSQSLICKMVAPFEDALDVPSPTRP